MDLDKLLELIDLETAEQFEYFENFADIVESDEDIPEEVLFQLFSKTEGTVVADIIGNYFDDMFENMPDESSDLYMILEGVKKALMGLITSKDDENNMIHFAAELDRFRRWYCKESKVLCTNVNTGEETTHSIRDAFVLYRLEKLEEDEYKYDFSECMDYEIDEYIMSVVDLASFEYDEEIEMEFAGEDEEDEYR